MCDRHVYIVMLKQHTLDLTIGDRLCVYDNQDYGLMGDFVVVEETTSEYFARHTFLDPVWYGYLIAKGEHDMFPPPYMKAILITDGAAQ